MTVEKWLIVENRIGWYTRIGYCDLIGFNSEDAAKKWLNERYDELCKEDGFVKGEFDEDGMGATIKGCDQDGDYQYDWMIETISMEV